MPDESRDQQRQIDELRQQVAVLKAVAQEHKQTQEAERKVLKSDLAESLARFEAEGARAREEAAKAREEAAKQRAADREADAKERAKDREALARVEAASKHENEKLRTDMEKRTGRQTALILTGIAVGVGVIGLWLRQGG